MGPLVGQSSLGGMCLARHEHSARPGGTLRDEIARSAKELIPYRDLGRDPFQMLGHIIGFFDISPSCLARVHALLAWLAQLLSTEQVGIFDRKKLHR